MASSAGSTRPQQQTQRRPEPSAGGVIDLTLDDDEEAPAVRTEKPKRRPPASSDAISDAKRARTTTAVTTQEPAWARKRGVPRIMLELRALRDEWDAPPRVWDVELVEDRATLWRFKVDGFDDSTEGGAQLNRDLHELGRRRGQSYILMEASFPDDYPNKPFFVRCVSPRFVWYTGHITAGGAICIEALTTSGTPGSWSPSHCVEAVLRTVFANMVHAERGYVLFSSFDGVLLFLSRCVRAKEKHSTAPRDLCPPGIASTAASPVLHAQVRTANGGGPTGPLRVDLQHTYTHDVLHAYELHEARAAFGRMLDHHRRHGW